MQTPANARVFGGGVPSVPSGTKNGQNSGKMPQKRLKTAFFGQKRAKRRIKGPFSAIFGSFSP
jgi:hypothetical protein